MNVEGRIAFAMKRAAAYKLAPATVQAREAADEFHEVSSIANRFNEARAHRLLLQPERQPVGPLVAPTPQGTVLVLIGPTGRTTAEAMKNLFLGMNVKRRMTLVVERAEADELVTGAPEPREFADVGNQVNTVLSTRAHRGGLFGVFFDSAVVIVVCRVRARNS